MNIDAIVNPLMDFFSHGIGQVIARVLQFLYTFMYPSNAPAATRQQ
ncbi:hypothetical protein ACQXZL_04405 [Corynebacterium diphtheriae]|nr:hypothetical protein [Corynebacterium diphtheriae]ERA48978.1 hypothetical protein B178_10288 [Corynebacterium diphtheriae DSM 43988]EIK55399.1 hypothetical protein W5M_10611 [Corynebacterium diphtheriae bv. intermedius str. NCTC 5011]ERA51506.1 hypothetical protein B179_10409 [Corynebacterium diphtheriae str. Aberdeen]KLN37622.1 hypothetical protein AL08_10505 [Corynebacterium diphtheriae bv. gravis str. ISS 4746]KLN43352.1 hypothetical protein AL09_10555 [Corynebacterium diphtheriae bv. gr